MPFKSFSLHALASLSWWLLVWMSQCQYGCVWLSLCAPNNAYAHALITLHTPLRWLTYINCCLQRYQLHQPWQCISLFSLLLQSQTISAPSVVETMMLLERLYTRTGVVTVLFVSWMKFIDILRDGVIFTGGTFGLFPSAGGTGSESRTVVSLPAVWMAGTCRPRNL